MKLFLSALIFLTTLPFWLLTHTSGPSEAFKTSEKQPLLYDSVVGSNTVRIMKIQANMVVDTADELLELVDRAKAKGANTVLYGDSKLNRFGLGASLGDRWNAETQKFITGVKQRDMDLLLMTITMGFCSSVISDEVQLTTGYPIKDQPLKRVGNELRPVSTAAIPNGGFERFSGNEPEGWSFQDAPGSRTFIDRSVKRSGNASFRAEAKGGNMSRIITAFDVKPFHQYTLRFWVKTQNLSAQNLLAVVRDENNKDRNLTNLRLSLPNDDGSRNYFNRPDNLTIDWTEMRIAFNSLNATQVNLGLSVFGGTNGSIWWDDVQVLDTPALNWINRDDLPVSIKRENGSNLSFGKDVVLPEDPKLGVSGFKGKYDTQHRGPKIVLGQNSGIAENETITISGYHALPTANGQVSCSWNHPEIYARMKQIHQTLENTYRPDGYLVNYSEIRTGGWEPLDTEVGTSGKALAKSIGRVFKDLGEVAPNARRFFWNDMVDPNHNAKANYYQVNNTLSESWTTLDPDKTVIATWWEGEKITKNGPNSLKFFSDNGFEQVIGAFYDADVGTNFSRWQTAATGISGIIGNMYATWRKDYSKIEAFGDFWWTERGSTTEDGAEIDSLSVATKITNVVPGETYNISVAYEAARERDIVILFQQNRAPWTNYGYVRKAVTKGSGEVTLSLQVAEEIPIENNGYKWTVFIAPKGKGWNDLLFVERIDPVSSTEPQQASSETNDTAASQSDAIDPIEIAEEPSVAEIAVYPNPIKTQETTLRFPDIQNNISARIYDMNGKLMATQQTKEVKEMKLTTGILPTGTYLLQISHDSGTSTKRILVD